MQIEEEAPCPLCHRGAWYSFNVPVALLHDCEPQAHSSLALAKPWSLAHYAIPWCLVDLEASLLQQGVIGRLRPFFRLSLAACA
jgi:hypothetical protein